MTKVTDEAGLALWQRALTSEIGLAIKTENRRSFQNAMYEIRKGHEEYQSLVIVLPGGKDDEVWICHKEVKLED